MTNQPQRDYHRRRHRHSLAGAGRGHLGREPAVSAKARLKRAAIDHQPSAIDLLLGLAFCALYLFTLVPSVLPADNGEFQLVAWKLGIAHPPGYPLYWAPSQMCSSGQQ